MRTINVKVPRITTERLDQFEVMFPGVTQVFGLRTIETREQAIMAANTKVMRDMPGEGYISTREAAASRTETGWSVDVVIRED